MVAGQTTHRLKTELTRPGVQRFKIWERLGTTQIGRGLYDTQNRNIALGFDRNGLAGGRAKRAKPGASCGEAAVAGRRHRDRRKQSEVLYRFVHRVDGLSGATVRPGRPATLGSEELCPHR